MAVSTVDLPPKLKRNNYTDDKNLTIKELKLLFITRLTYGAYVIHFITNNKVLNILFKIFCPFLGSFIAISCCLFKNISVIQIVIKYAFVLGYTLFVAQFYITSSNKKLTKFFKIMNSFDELINIKSDTKFLTSINSFNFLTITLILLDWGLLLISYSSRDSLLPPNALRFVWFFDIFVITIAHTSEQIFYIAILRIVYKRVVILRAHALKLLHELGGAAPSNVTGAAVLFRNKELDIDTLHTAYHMLHDCATTLNTVMSLPMLTVIVANGINTIAMMSRGLFFFQKHNNSYAFLVYYIITSIKYTILLITPCYYASVTGTQVSIIRSKVNDAINVLPLDKLCRRKYKTFLSLCKSCCFEYALFGVIKLNMALPLKYLNLCFTYLIIIVQFGKFID